MAKPRINIQELQPADKLDLIEQIWESLSVDPKKIPLTNAQREELDRRLDDMEADGGAGIPWQLVLERIKAGR